MRQPAGYFLSIPVAIMLLLGAWAGGPGYWIVPVLAFLLTPVLERVLGHSRWPSDNALKAITPGRARQYELALLSAAAVTLAILAWGLRHAGTTALTGPEFAGLAVSLGIMTSLTGIVVAHELVHRDSRAHRLLAWVLMSAAIYPHFCIEHVLGHHPRFATPEDPASARRGESLCRFIPRSALGGLASSLRIRPAPVLAAYAAIALFLAALFAWSLSAALLFLAQAAIAVVLLEGINYLEHYGLTRRRLASGRYEAPGPAHSWDTSVLMTNLNVFNLGRHSDHHSFSRRPYYRLRHNEEAPQLPHGYASMFLLALVPPAFFATMNPRLDAFQARREAGEGSREAGRAACA